MTHIVLDKKTAARKGAMPSAMLLYRLKRNLKETICKITFTVATLRAFFGLVPKSIIADTFEANSPEDVDPEALVLQRPLTCAVYENVVFDPRYDAVYRADGRLIPETALVRGPERRRINAPEIIQVDPSEMTRRPEMIFGGVLFDSHYGHFLSETMARLWPVLDEEMSRIAYSTPWLFRRISFSSDPETKLLDFLTQEELPEFIGFPIAYETPMAPIKIDRLIVPEPANINKYRAHPVFRDLCRRVGAHVLKKSGGLEAYAKWAGERVYLSRAHLRFSLRRLVGEERLERKLRAGGYKIVYPEELALPEQIAIFSLCSEVAAPLGSSLHTALCGQSERIRIFCITDEIPQLTFHVFDRICNAETTYILAMSNRNYSSKFFPHVYLDVDRVTDKILGPPQKGVI